MRDSRIIFFTAFAFLFLAIDVWLGHLGGRIAKPAMWIPLIFLPLIFSAALAASFSRAHWVVQLFNLFCRAAVAVGAAGFCFHLLRVSHDLKSAMEWQAVFVLLRNPPLLAPLAIAGLGILGIWANE